MSLAGKRQNLFNNICDEFEENAFKSERALAVYGDALEKLKKVPNNSISLILTDPPYHSTKKTNITNDTAFANDKDFLNWINKFAKEWKRILKPNGSFFIFCSSAMSASIEVLLSDHFNILSHVVWTKPNDPGFDGWKGKMKKESLRQWYPHSERILFGELAVPGNLNRSWFGNFLREQRNKCGLSGHQLTELTGAYGKVNHGGAVSNWETGRNIPSRTQYKKICEALIDTGKISEMPLYEDVIRKFDVNSEIEFTDVWNFNSVRPYKGKHPAEKPLDMLEHCILATTYENDIILDCFAGSGSTTIAALNTNRLSISFEIEKKWFDTIKDRISKYENTQHVRKIEKNKLMKSMAKKKGDHQPTLFS